MKGNVRGGWGGNDFSQNSREFFPKRSPHERQCNLTTLFNITRSLEDFGQVVFEEHFQHALESINGYSFTLPTKILLPNCESWFDRLPGDAVELPFLI